MESFLSLIDDFFVTCTGFLFGPIMLVVFFGTGLLMTIVTRGIQFRKFGTAVREVIGNLRRKNSGDGQLKLERLERTKDRSDAIWRESISPEAKHNMYLQYLLALCKKMKEKFNVEYIWGEAV